MIVDPSLFALQIMTRDVVTLKEVIMTLVNTTGRTMWTFLRITTMSNVTNREDTVGPFH